MNWNVVAVIAAMMLYGYLAWMMCRRQIGAGMRRVRDLPRGLQALFAVVAIVATVEAQKAGTNDTNNASGGTNMMMSVGSSVPLDRNRYTSTIRTTTSIRHFSSSWIQTNFQQSLTYGSNKTNERKTMKASMMIVTLLTAKMVFASVYFSNITNQWYTGSQTNVYVEGMERLSTNQNDRTKASGPGHMPHYWQELKALDDDGFFSE